MLDQFQYLRFKSDSDIMVACKWPKGSKMHEDVLYWTTFTSLLLRIIAHGVSLEHTLVLLLYATKEWSEGRPTKRLMNTLSLSYISLLRLKMHSFSSSPKVKFLGACKPMHIAQLASLNIGTLNFKFVVFLSTNRIWLLSSNILWPCENNNCFKRATKHHIWGTINLAFMYV